MSDAAIIMTQVALIHELSTTNLSQLLQCCIHYLVLLLIFVLHPKKGCKCEEK
jgi:hypothetical protein